MLENNPQLKEQILYIMNVFHDAYTYIKFVNLVNEMSNRESTGDQAAKQILDVITHFYNLVKISQDQK